MCEFFGIFWVASLVMILSRSFIWLYLNTKYFSLYNSHISFYPFSRTPCIICFWIKLTNSKIDLSAKISRIKLQHAINHIFWNYDNGHWQSDLFFFSLLRFIYCIMLLVYCEILKLDMIFLCFRTKMHSSEQGCVIRSNVPITPKYWVIRLGQTESLKEKTKP